MKKVSVIVPVYNAENYLKKCLKSIIHQTLDDIEIIAVNDGSTDSSLEILKDFQAIYSDKFRVFSKENGGQGMARNIAIKYAEGEYIGFVDADDYVDLTTFEKLYNKAKEKDYDIVFCDHYEVKDSENIYKGFKDYNDKREMFVDVLVSPWNKLIKKDVLVNSGVKFPEGYIYEDTAWFINLIPYFETFGIVHEPLVYHIVQENSTMTSKQEEKTAQIFPVMEDVLNFYKARGLSEDYKDELEYFYLRIILMSSLERIYKIQDKKLRRTLIDKSFDEVKTKFPNYKDNKYLVGQKKLYIKLINKFNAVMVLSYYNSKNQEKK